MRSSIASLFSYLTPQDVAVILSFPQNSLTLDPRTENAMFYIVGLGLCDEKDITIRGLEVQNPHRLQFLADGVP